MIVPTCVVPVAVTAAIEPVQVAKLPAMLPTAILLAKVVVKQDVKVAAIFTQIESKSNQKII